MADRPKIPSQIEADVEEQSRRRCCICAALNGDLSRKKGQIAHLDGKPANNDPDNLAFFCLDHHDEYDSTTNVSKNLGMVEVKRYRAELLARIAKGELEKPAVGGAVSPEVFARREAVYDATVKFLRAVLTITKIKNEDMWEFFAATDKALFLFDKDLDAYLAELRAKGARLRAVATMLEPPEKRTRQLIDEEQQLVAWFLAETEKVRERFAPFLRVS
jgi:hypothetical protein